MATQATSRTVVVSETRADVELVVLPWPPERLADVVVVHEPA